MLYAPCILYTFSKFPIMSFAKALSTIIPRQSSKNRLTIKYDNQIPLSRFLLSENNSTWRGYRLNKLSRIFCPRYDLLCTHYWFIHTWLRNLSYNDNECGKINLKSISAINQYRITLTISNKFDLIVQWPRKPQTIQLFVSPSIKLFAICE